MPIWLLRLVWKVRGKRWARLHLVGDHGSVEGILAGRWGGHYVMLTATYLQAKDQSIRMDGHLEVPAAEVVFVQILARDGK